MDDLRKAIADEGTHPEYHRALMSRHRREWPKLWAAIDAVLLGRSPEMTDPALRALLNELDACTPRFEGGAPNATNAGSTAFSGWYVPDWLMHRVRDALAAAEAAPFDVERLGSLRIASPIVEYDGMTGSFSADDQGVYFTQYIGSGEYGATSLVARPATPESDYPRLHERCFTIGCALLDPEYAALRSPDTETAE